MFLILKAIKEANFKSDTIKVVRIRILTILFAFILFPTSAVVAQNSAAEGITTNEVVSQQCSQSQRYLKETLKPRDLRARVDRLQAYRYIYQRIDIYVERLEKNNQNGAKELRVSVNKLLEKIDEFKNTYETYDTTRELAANFQNCSKTPGQFIKSIDASRIERQKLANLITDINQILEKDINDQLQNLYKEQVKVESNTGN